MKTAEASLLIIPGWGNSGPEHWQSRWEKKLSTAIRVEQANWAEPAQTQWVNAVLDAILEAPKPVILIAHGLGAVAAMHAASLLSGRAEAARLAGAFLVAPPSEATILSESAIDPAFAPYPTAPLPCPSLLVASRNDPWCAYETAADYANAWGSALVDAGEAGHINTESGHGPWPEGILRLAGFMQKL